MFNWLCPSVLHVRFFCIISWSSPVITITMKMPLTNCFQKYCLSVASSRTNTLSIPLSLMMSYAPERPISILSQIHVVMSMRAESSTNVWIQSLQTMVLIPLCLV